MTEIGTIIRSYIGKNRDSKDNVLLHQTQMVEDDDEQTIEQMHMPGIQYNPPVGSRNFIQKITDSWKLLVGVFDLVGRVSLNPGEMIIYSSTGGAVAASIRWNDDGSIDITAPGDVNITGDVHQTGDLFSTGNISADGDVIADLLVTAISLLTHLHLGELGGTVGVPQQGASATPTPFATHTHAQPNDGGGDAEAETNVPT